MRIDNFMKFASMGRCLLCVGLAAGLTSCASVSVTNVVPLNQQSPPHVPRGIFVRPFEFEEGMVRVNREGEKLGEFEKSMQTEMTKNLVERLRKYLAPTDGLPGSAEVPPGDYWVITGKFTRVNQGSRALRSTVGFGAGGTKLDVSATVSDHSEGGERPFVLIQTTGGSNAMPGAIMGIIAWPMVLWGGHGLTAGISADSRRTARELTSALVDYLRKSGVDASAEAPKPKMKGQLPPALQLLPPKEATESEVPSH